jgi:hypothetical protein
MSAKQLHAIHIQGLPADILFAHEDVTFKPESRRDRRTGDAVLACPGLGYHPLLTHMLGEKRLPNGVVHFVGARVIEVLAF